MAAEIAFLQLLVSLRQPLLDEIAVSITALGSPVFVLVTVASLYLFREKEASLIVLSGAVVAGILEKSINLLVARPRPDLPYLFESAGMGSSFPSGHATIAFLLATVLYREYGRPAFLFTLAGLVAVSRLYIGVHYPSDVIAGALLGAGTGVLVLRYRAELLSRLKRYI
ncbi:MAG: phosphatase PAP2 family protein [Candidatus Nanohaloarchaeota archaeon QJJ-7]|nr:phosphatase PAP2 family protein [Candidatus Nanohaloarchaeota archaeon QJJ-7]